MDSHNFLIVTSLSKIFLFFYFNQLFWASNHDRLESVSEYSIVVYCPTEYVSDIFFLDSLQNTNIENTTKKT